MFTVSRNIEDGFEYVPNFLNNRELAETYYAEGATGPVPFFTVELTPMSSRDENKITTGVVAGMRDATEAPRRAEVANGRCIAQYVAKVTGLTLEDVDGARHQPRNGKELWDLAVGSAPWIRDELVEDVLQALKDVSRAREGDLKKLKSRYAGRKQGPATSLPRENGAAQDATPTMSNAEDSR